MRAKSTRLGALSHAQGMKLDPHTLTMSDVREMLGGVTAQRIHQLDDVLKPIRKGTQHERRYDPAVVAAYVAKRAKR
jgi:hypothetical protein